jgi:hypothetical protein
MLFLVNEKVQKTCKSTRLINETPSFIRFLSFLQHKNFPLIKLLTSKLKFLCLLKKIIY